jgi:molybdopterin converting factor small subunit
MNPTIDLRLFATLAEYRPEDPERYAIAPGTTLSDLIRRLGIPEADVKIAFVNSIQVPLDTPLENGDRVGLFPPIGGG